jgi:hypothetical protein
VRSNAATTAGSVTVGVTGSSNSQALIRPFARSTGLEGGAGGDEVFNDGSAFVRATSTGTSSNSTTQVFGSSGANAGATTEAAALGIGGGADNDLLVNRNLLDVGSTSSATVTGSSWTLAGGAAGRSALSASGEAAGMAGGVGADDLRNQGVVNVNAGSTLTTTGGSRAIFGGAGSATQLAASVTASGLAGGDGADRIANALNVDVNGTATVSANKSSVSFAGDPSTSALLAARAEATGIAGGSDGDELRNEGTLGVDAKAVADVQGGAAAEAGGDTTSSGFARADAMARGMDGGVGNDTLTNTKAIVVEGITDAAVRNSSSAGFFFSDGTTASNTRTGIDVTGLSGGAGDNAIANSGDVTVSTIASGYSFAYAVGGTFSIEGDANATSTAQATATATGISGESADDREHRVHGGAGASARHVHARARRERERGWPDVHAQPAGYREDLHRRDRDPAG